MKELIVPSLMVNLLMFIIGIVLGVNPALITVSTPGGYVFQVAGSAIIFSLIAVVISVGSLVGIRVLGSGISDTSVNVIIRCVVYFVTWSILSAVTYSFLTLLPFPFGEMIYATLTLLFAFGVFLSIGSIGGGGVSEGGASSSGGGEEA